jgi:hypothetical protein
MTAKKEYHEMEREHASFIRVWLMTKEIQIALATASFRDNQRI